MFFKTEVAIKIIHTMVLQRGTNLYNDLLHLFFNDLVVFHIIY